MYTDVNRMDGNHQASWKQSVTGMEESRWQYNKQVIGSCVVKSHVCCCFRRGVVLKYFKYIYNKKFQFFCRENKWCWPGSIDYMLMNELIIYTIYFLILYSVVYNLT